MITKRRIYHGRTLYLLKHFFSCIDTFATKGFLIGYHIRLNLNMNVTIALNRPSRIYHPGDIVAGVIIIDCKTEVRHDGITLSLEGILSIQNSTKSAGLLESLVHSPKPVILVSYSNELSRNGKLQSGRTQLSFEFPLRANPNRTLHETFHGIHIVIQYVIRCDIKRSLLAKDVFKTQEIILHLNQGDGDVASIMPLNFQIHPESLQNVRERARIPKFLVKGSIESAEISLCKAISGELSVIECERGISSIELQLVRVETCGSNEVNTREVSEIQNIQICSGDIARNLRVPFYMKLPRLFTCATLLMPTFKIEFELNIIIIFDNDHLVLESFPVKLTRH